MLLLLCAVMAHSIAQEAFKSVAVHTIATSSSLAGSQSLVQRVEGGEDEKEEEVVGKT